MRLTQSDIKCACLYIFWTEILRGFRISGQDCGILPVWPVITTFVVNNIGKT